MTFSLAASHARGKFATDKIFEASALAGQATAKYGRDQVVNATIGAFMDEKEALACIPTVEKVLRNLPINEMINYAPIAGLPDYLKAATELTFAESRPDAYIDAVATAGGAGVIHHTIWNYSEIGDTVITSDWYWDPYEVLCEEALRKLETFTLFDDKQNFNISAFAVKVSELLKRQDSLVVILNAPAHNPTGYSLTDAEWEQVLAVCKEQAETTAKRIILLIDIAYLDFAGEKHACRTFLKKFGGLPANILAVLAFSMSKGYTMYGQRTGAMIGISSSKEVIREFAGINQFTSRATWSNINRGAMSALAAIYQDKSILAQVEQERSGFSQLIRKRAEIFMREAQDSGLDMLPYRAGFFLTVPADDPDAVCGKLQEELIYAVPLVKGVRIAICAVPSVKVAGMASKFAKAAAALKQK